MIEMLTAERWRYILDKIDRNKTVQVTELVTELNVSESTIRRDLSELEKQELLVRVHGGAEGRFETTKEPRFHDKIVENVEGKNKIAAYAAQVIHDNEAIFIDAGTTSLAMAPYLKDKKGLKIITNGLRQAEVFGEMGLDVSVLGGHIKSGTLAVVGIQAIQQMEQFYFDRVFLGINGVEITAGLTTPDIQEALIKQTAIKQSRQAYVLADASKFNKVSFAKVAELDQAIIFTDELSPEDAQKFEEVAEIEEANQ